MSCVILYKENEKIQRSDLTGIWIVTDNNDTKKFNDTWEFKENGIYNELKLIGAEGSEVGDGSLVADENGTWKLSGDTLTIIVTGEYTDGKPYLYEEPVTWSFQVSKKDNVLKFNVLTMSHKTNPTTLTLKLTRKQ